jgi:hypothetical protein
VLGHRATGAPPRKARAGQRDDNPGPGHCGAGRAGQTELRLPLRRLDRDQRDPDHPGALARKHHALARRLLGRQDDYLRFTQDFAVSPDNHGTGRDTRMAKLRQKVSEACAPSPGTRQSCPICSYLSTAAKHGRSFFDALVRRTASKPDARRCLIYTTPISGT